MSFDTNLIQPISFNSQKYQTRTLSMDELSSLNLPPLQQNTYNSSKLTSTLMLQPLSTMTFPQLTPIFPETPKSVSRSLINDFNNSDITADNYNNSGDEENKEHSHNEDNNYEESEDDSESETEDDVNNEDDKYYYDLLERFTRNNVDIEAPIKLKYNLTRFLTEINLGTQKIWIDNKHIPINSQQLVYQLYPYYRIVNNMKIGFEHDYDLPEAITTRVNSSAFSNRESNVVINNDYGVLNLKILSLLFKLSNEYNKLINVDSEYFDESLDISKYINLRQRQSLVVDFAMLFMKCFSEKLYLLRNVSANSGPRFDPFNFKFDDLAVILSDSYEKKNILIDDIKLNSQDVKNIYHKMDQISKNITRRNDY
jgi:hypothetical protein